MKQFVSVDLSFLSTTDQVLCRQDHITVSFADEAGKEFHHLSYPWAQRKKIVVQIDKLNSHWSIGQFKELYVLFLYM